MRPPTAYSVTARCLWNGHCHRTNGTSFDRCSHGIPQLKILSIGLWFGFRDDTTHVEGPQPATFGVAPTSWPVRLAAGNQYIPTGQAGRSCILSMVTFPFVLAIPEVEGTHFAGLHPGGVVSPRILRRASITVTERCLRRSKVRGNQEIRFNAMLYMAVDTGSMSTPNCSFACWHRLSTGTFAGVWPSPPLGRRS